MAMLKVSEETHKRFMKSKAKMLVEKDYKLTVDEFLNVLLDLEQYAER